jgi:hypothetical protein
VIRGLVQERLPVGWHPSRGPRCGLTYGMRMRRKQLHSRDHPLFFVVEEPVLTRLETGNDRMPGRGRVLGCNAGSENCRSNRRAHTPHTDGDETTSLSVTPGIPHTRHHSASKRGRFRADPFSRPSVLSTTRMRGIARSCNDGCASMLLDDREVVEGDQRGKAADPDITQPAAMQRFYQPGRATPDHVPEAIRWARGLC